MSVRWTMGRLLGEKATDLIMSKLRKDAIECRTQAAPVHGGDFQDREELIKAIMKHVGPATPASAVAHLADTFGSHWSDVLKMHDSATLLPDGATLAAEVRYAARNEMAVTLADIVLRRLDLGTGSMMSAELLKSCARIAGEELGWDLQRQNTEIARLARSYPFASPVSQQIVNA